MVAGQPGNLGSLNHLAWCYRTMAEALEATNDPTHAALFRKKEAAANAKSADRPIGDTAAGMEFKTLASKNNTTFVAWWAFSQRLQMDAEKEPDPAVRQRFYVKWLHLASAAAAERTTGHPINTVPAFIHNRLAVQFLETDPALSANHASLALKLRRDILEANPGDASHGRNVLSSASHLSRAAVRGDSAAAALSAIQQFRNAAGQMPPAALVEQEMGITFAKGAAAFLQSAAKRWSESRADFVKVGEEIAAQLIDRLPEDRKTKTASTVREFLVHLDGVP